MTTQKPSFWTGGCLNLYKITTKESRRSWLISSFCFHCECFIKIKICWNKDLEFRVCWRHCGGP